MVARSAVWRHVALAAAAACALAGARADAAAAHPLHSSLAELRYLPAERAMEISLRVFADDFAAAVARAAGSTAARDRVTEDAAFAYVATAFVVTARDGRRIPLARCGARRGGDLLWLCLRVPAPGGIGGLRVRSAILFERFADQVNIVQAEQGGRRQTLLFTRGDAPKVLQ